MSHSPEPWEWIEGLLVSVPDDRLAILSLSNYPTDYEDEVDRRNMERIVACVNACAHIPTHVLEALISDRVNLSYPPEYRYIK